MEHNQNKVIKSEITFSLSAGLVILFHDFSDKITPAPNGRSRTFLLYFFPFDHFLF